MKNVRSWWRSLVLFAGSGALIGSSAVGDDWPQYRGPTRDGVVPAGPKLLNSWPEKGPQLLWKSATLWDKYGGGKDGDLLPHAGCGSIVIAGGRAFVFANFKRNADTPGKVVLSTKELIELGWMEGVPSDLAEKVEEERTRGPAAKMKRGPELVAHARQYVAALDPDLARRFGDWVERRLGKVPPTLHVNRLIEAEGSKLNDDPIFEWSFLEKLAAVRDKEFPTVAALDAELGGALNPWTSSSGNGIRVFSAEPIRPLLRLVDLPGRR